MKCECACQSWIQITRNSKLWVHSSHHVLKEELLISGKNKGKAIFITIKKKKNTDFTNFWPWLVHQFANCKWSSLNISNVLSFRSRAFLTWNKSVVRPVALVTLVVMYSHLGYKDLTCYRDIFLQKKHNRGKWGEHFNIFGRIWFWTKSDMNFHWELTAASNMGGRSPWTWSRDKVGVQNSRRTDLLEIYYKYHGKRRENHI